MKLIIDTSIIIDKLRDGEEWDRFLRNVDKEAELYIPTVVIFEIYSGTSSRKAIVANKIQNSFAFFQKVDLNDSIAKRAGEIYRDISTQFSVADFLIAATALELGAQVVTLNKKHSQKIPGVRVYDFENRE